MAVNNVVTADYAVKVPDGDLIQPKLSFTCAGVTTPIKLSKKQVEPGPNGLFFTAGGLLVTSLFNTLKKFYAHVIAQSISTDKLLPLQEVVALTL